MSKPVRLTEEKKQEILDIAHRMAACADAIDNLTLESISKDCGFSKSTVRNVIGSINDFRKQYNLPALGKIKLKKSRDTRRDSILTAAMVVARRPGGWSKLTRDDIAIEAGCTNGLVSKYFGTMVEFRRTIMRTAIAQKDLKILGQALACEYPYAFKASPDLRKEALNSLSV